VAREEAKRSPASRKWSKRIGEEWAQTHPRIAAAEDVEEMEEEEGIESDLLVKI